ncbi:MAG: hypothetical protein KAS32_08510 [Candidatus Peribacteraceae bacterium]|nr:hypothetical protein [Candidatus Peribacteraceae bacterium]
MAADVNTQAGMNVAGTPQAGTGAGGIPTTYEESPINQMLGAGKNEAKNRMADVAQQQADIALEQWGMYKQVFAPYEAELVGAHRTIIPKQLGLDLATLKAKQADIEGQMPINEEIRQQQMRSLERSESTEQQFYDKINQGLSVEDAMSAAGADVQQAYDSSAGQLRRGLSRAGVVGGGDKFTDAMAKMSYSRAKDIAFARTNARRMTDQTNLKNLGLGMQVRGNIAGMSTRTGAGTTNPLNQGMASIGMQKAGQTFAGLSGAQEGFQQVAQADAGQAQSGISAVGTAISAFSDERLKTKVIKIGTKHKLPWYVWMWNDLAKELFGLEGTEVGHMATEVQEKYPRLVNIVSGYKTVNYGGLS